MNAESGTASIPFSSQTVSVDEFQALEGKVLQAVETIRRERDARAAVKERLLALQEATSTAETELDDLRREREALRGRVERMLTQMDELL